MPQTSLQTITPPSAQPQTGADLVMALLEAHGITHVAGVPGGAALPLYDALGKSAIRHVLARHEQGAGFIAQGMARVTGKPQVCLASSGPGATNLVTAVADARLDSIPLIVITGQVPLPMLGTDAFQEIDTFGLMLPITKHNYVVRSAAELLEVIPEAFEIATSGRPGPVAIDIPKDVQLEPVTPLHTPAPAVREELPHPRESDVLQMQTMLAEAKRPVLMTGGGIVASGCTEAVRELVNAWQMPVVSTFMGLGVIPASHPLQLGMLGMHGSVATHRVLEECDLLIGAGVRFDDRATGKVSAFCPNASIVHIDIDQSEIHKVKRADLAINADVGTTLRAFNAIASPTPRPAWVNRVHTLAKAHPLPAAPIEETWHPYHLFDAVDRATRHEAIVVTDVGQHQMWTAQAFPFSRPRQWISSGGLGTMGFGLPAAIGAAMAEPDRPVICVTGDGSLLMNLQELDTLAEHNLNVKILVLNNQNLGLVRQQQTLFYGNRHNALGNTRHADFAAIGTAMGIPAEQAPQDCVATDWLSRRLTGHGPVLLDLPLDPDVHVMPMVPPGAANVDAIEESQR